jgi:hypothetical protein
MHVLRAYVVITDGPVMQCHIRYAGITPTYYTISNNVTYEVSINATYVPHGVDLEHTRVHILTPNPTAHVSFWPQGCSRLPPL